MKIKEAKIAVAGFIALKDENDVDAQALKDGLVECMAGT